jgi:hypothetical protein
VPATDPAFQKEHSLNTVADKFKTGLHLNLKFTHNAALSPMSDGIPQGRSDLSSSSSCSSSSSVLAGF